MKPKYTDGRYPHGYRKAIDTDITKTWARARKQMEDEKRKREEVMNTVSQLPRKTANGR